MAKKVFELKQERAKLIADARAITEADPELRSLPAEKQAEVDRIMGEVDDLDQFIERLQRIDVAAEAAGAPDESAPPEQRSQRGGERRSIAINARGGDGASLHRGSVYDLPEYRSAFLGWMASGQLDMAPEYRGMILGTNSSGGYLVTPTQLSRDILQVVNNLCFVRQMATVETVDTAQSLGVRSVATQPSDAAWTTEIGTISPDTSAAFGRRDLTPQQLTKLIKASIRLLNTSPEAEAWIKERLGYLFGIAEENAFLNADGNGKPLGVFTASNDGIPTSRDYAITAVGQTAVLADQIVSAKYQVKQPYWSDRTFAWCFSRELTNRVRLLKDSQGRYLWTDGLASAPDTVCGIPVKISEYCPSTFTANSYVGALGVWSNYRIADARQMEMQRLVELYAATSEVGFLARRWLDGTPVMPESWVRLKVAAAS